VHGRTLTVALGDATAMEQSGHDVVIAKSRFTRLHICRTFWKFLKR